MNNILFFFMGSFLRFFENDSIRKITAALDTALNGRSLDVDTEVLSLTTGPEESNFWSSDPFPFFTRDYKRFVTPRDTELGNWNRFDPVYLHRGESGFDITRFLAMYPDAVTRVGKTDYDVSCTSSLGKLTQFGHKGGIYDSTTQTTAGNLLREIAGYVNGYPGSVAVRVAPEFEDIILYGWLPYLSPTGENGAAIGSARDNFLQVIFAINACLRDDPDGVLRVENLPLEAAADITESRIYRAGARVIDEQPITSVTVLEHAYVVGSDTQTLFEGNASAGQTIVFNRPMANLTATGFSITEQGANYAVLSSGSGTLTGTPYLDTTREIVRNVSSALVQNTERIEKATLVSLTNSADVADRLADYYACRKWIECDAVIQWEKPGNVINIWDPYDEVMRSACIEKISPLVVSGTMKGHISALVGFKPWQTTTFNDVVEVLKSNTTWRAADHPGVKYLTVYIISGAQGGSRGGDGQPAPQPTIQTSSFTAEDNTTNQKGINFDQAHSPAGAGGAAGRPGSGGRINRIELSLAGNETFAVTIGTGGAGATAPNVEGAYGTDSTFGSYSSAGGSSSDYGVTDPKTGITYGLPGAAGTKGNDGSSFDNTPAPIGGNANGSKGSKWSETYFDDAPCNYLAIGWGTYGGGAAVGHAGGDGNSGISVGSVSRSSIAASLTAPGKGADASPPAKATNAQGGTGGNGGGGNGAYVTAGVVCSFNNKTSSAGSLNLSFDNQSAAGAGSRGGNGGNGVVILIYREPVT